jgi:hypothetical protein
MPLRVVVRLTVIELLRSLTRNAVRSGLAMLGIAVAVADGYLQHDVHFGGLARVLHLEPLPAC